MQRILVIRFSSIGDIVLTSPVVRALRTKFPEADIRFVTKRQYSELVENNSRLNRVHYLDDSLNKLATELKSFKPDLVVDLHHNLRTRILKSLVGGKWVSFHKLNVEKWLRINLKVDRLPNEHIVDRYLKTVEEFGVVNDHKGLEFFFPSNFQVPEIPARLKDGFVAVVVGAKFKTKQLPKHKLIDICAGISKPVLLIGGPDDKELGEAIANKPEGIVVNGCGQFSLAESGWMLQQSELVITHDTGMMHIAAAFQKKIISIWGNTIPEFGMYPYLQEIKSSYVSEVAGLSCRPCSKIGFHECPKGHFRCMEEQDVSVIMGQVEKLLS